jgi:outer membrane protein assembly factor BamB
LFISGTKDVLIRYYNPTRALSVPYTLMNVMYDYGMVSVDADAYQFADSGELVVDEAGRIDVADEGARFEIVDGSQDSSYLWTRYTNADGIVFEHLRHTNGHVYPDNPDSLILPEDPSVWFSVGDAILEFFIQNPRK